MNFNYTHKDIAVALQSLPLKKGDSLFIHSNLGFFGRLKDSLSQKDYYTAFKNALFEIIGSEGTLIAPVFSYSFCHKQPFDPAATGHTCGFFSDEVLKDPASVRSLDANFSIAAIGKHAVHYTENPPEYSFGENSFWERFLKNDGIVLNFNFDSGSTFIHFVEKLHMVPYRYDKAFPGIINYLGQPVEKTFYHFVYDLEKPNHAPDFTKFDKKAKERGLAQVASLGKGQVLYISAKDSLQLITETLINEPSFLIKGNL